MKRLFLFAMLIALIAFPALADDALPEWEAILPESYETSGLYYPVVYVLPGDASSMDESGLARALMDAPGLDMIVVRMALPEGAEAMEALHSVIAQADAAYRTIPDAQHRIAAGTGAGGYLAYIAALEEEPLFGSAVSIRGDLASEENPWLKEYGQVRDLMRQKRRRVPDFFEKTYTYLDTPADDLWTDLPGSTDDIGSLMIGWSIGSASHEFTVRPGAFDDGFLAESAARAKDRISAFLLAGALEGELRPESTALAPGERTVQADFGVTVGERLLAHAPEGLELTVNLVLSDQETGAALASAGVPYSLGAAGTAEGKIAIEVPEGIAAAQLSLRVSLLGAEEELASVPIVCGRGASLEGDILSLDLSGDWHFHYSGTREALDPGSLTAQDWQDWPVVQPGLASWTKGFGNISDANVTSGYGADYFDYFITGNGYYAREFTLPEGAAGLDTVLSIGYVDDRCEVYVNGTRIGATGMDAAGRSTGETTWAQYSCFDVPEGILIDGGVNTVAVRAWNDLPYGAGGWYAGPIGLYSRAAFEAMQGGGKAGFREESFDSAWAASAGNVKGTAEVKYLVLLPESYETSGRSYPTLYLLHQFNSDHTSYRTDGVDQLILEGAREGLFDEMIVIVPNSSEQSWWRGDWEKMVTEELIPHIDGKYRTVRDARYRFTAGCSMGGQGAMGIALHNPDLFSGVISFYGAFSYGYAADPRAAAARESADYLDSFTMAFICGNQDSYGFGTCAIDLHKLLVNKDVEHLFFIENGGHSSSFYLPYFKDIMAWTRGHMYKSDPAAEELLSGTITREGAVLHAELTADAGIGAYLYAPPASGYTKDPEPKLIVPMRLELVKDGETLYADEARDILLTGESLGAQASFDLSQAGDAAKGAKAVLYAELFDRLVLLASIDIP